MPTRDEIITNLYKLDLDELAVLYWTAKGESAAGIGKRIFKSESTARSKRTEVYRKIGLFELRDEDKKPYVRQYYEPVMFELGMTDRNIRLPDREPSKEETEPEEAVSEGLPETPREENIQIPDREPDKKETEPEEEVTKKPAETPRDEMMQPPDREPSKEEAETVEEVSEGAVVPPGDENIQPPDSEPSKEETETVKEVSEGAAERPGDEKILFPVQEPTNEGTESEETKPLGELPQKPSETPRHGTNVFVVLAGVVVVLLIVAFGCWWVFTRVVPALITTQPPATLQTTSEIPSRTSIQPSETSTNTPEVTEPVVIVPSSTRTERPTETVTNTPVKRSVTQGPPANPTHTPSPTVDMTNVLFSDDFEQGPEDGWEVVQGQPIYSNGTVTGSERVMAVTGNKDWKNLVLENETWGGPCDPYYSNSLIIKFIDLRNYLGVSYQSCSAHFVVIKDGVAQHIPNGINISHSDGSKFKIIITANDGYFTASVGPQTFDYYDDRFMTGMVGYYVDPGCFLDSFKVSELP